MSGRTLPSPSGPSAARRSVQAVVLERFGGVEGFAARERAEADPGPGEIRIDVRAVGFNPVDVKARQGALGGALPMLLGRDVSGVVSAVGGEGTGFSVGDAVYARANEAYAESLVLPAALAARKPERLGFAEAAALPVAGLTAYDCVVRRARVEPGQAVLVAGASGGVGSVAVQLLRHRGVRVVLATAGSDASAEHLTRRLGVPAEHVVRYRGRTPAELVAQVRTSNGGHPVDAAFDFVGGAMKRLCFDAVGVEGQVVSIVEEPADFDLDVWDERASPLMQRSVSFHFVQLGARVAHGDPRGWIEYRRRLEELARLVDAGALPPGPITDVGPFSLASVRRAHALLESGHVHGKLVSSVGA